MTTARRIIVGVLLPLAIIGALTLSASATVDLFTSQGVPGRIAPAAVLMLEVASLAGTLLWVLVERRSLRRDAIVVTVAATGVALVAGWHAYGPVGSVAGVALVLTVHLASRAWREDWTETAPAVAEPVAEPATVAELVALHQDAGDGAVVEPAPPPDQPESAPLLPDVPGVGPATVATAADLIAAAPAIGRPTLMRELGVNDHQARKLLAALRPLAVAS